MKFFKIIKKPDKEKEKKKIEDLQNEPLEKNDKFAMLLASFLTLFLPAVLILVALCLLAMWLFGAFG